MESFKDKNLEFLSSLGLVRKLTDYHNLVAELIIMYEFDKLFRDNTTFEINFTDKELNIHPVMFPGYVATKLVEEVAETTYMVTQAGINKKNATSSRE